MGNCALLYHFPFLTCDPVCRTQTSSQAWWAGTAVFSLLRPPPLPSSTRLWRYVHTAPSGQNSCSTSVHKAGARTNTRAWLVTGSRVWTGNPGILEEVVAFKPNLDLQGNGASGITLRRPIDHFKLVRFTASSWTFTFFCTCLNWALESSSRRLWLLLRVRGRIKDRPVVPYPTGMWPIFRKISS